MKQFLAQGGALRQDGDLFRCAGQGGSGKGRLGEPAIKIVEAPVGVDAGARIALADAGLVVADPAQAARPVDLSTPAMTASFHDRFSLSLSSKYGAFPFRAVKTAVKSFASPPEKGTHP